ncbi:hypothetical protein ACA910_015199 [Epithemia clementina (nom. ined.)]
MSSPAETAVKKLARLEGNTVCPNCGTHKKFGFSTVCMKYLTFVCNHCKSSHQAISHRCKSLTMSSWTEGEVLQLKKAGNDVARATWVARAPPIGTQGRPKEGDSLDIFKAFIVDVYERKRYYSEGGQAAAVGVPLGRQTSTQPPPQQQQQQQHPPPPPPQTSRPTPPPQPVAPPAPPPPPPSVDLFSFDSAPAAPSNSFFAGNSGEDPFAPSAGGGNNAMSFATFDNPSESNNNNNPISFGDFESHTALTPATPAPAPFSFDPFTGASSQGSGGGSNSDFGEFSGFSSYTSTTNFGANASATAPAPVDKKPIMNSANTSAQSAMISNMSAQQPQQQQQQQMRMMQQQQQMRMMMSMQNQQGGMMMGSNPMMMMAANGGVMDNMGGGMGMNNIGGGMGINSLGGGGGGMSTMMMQQPSPFAQQQQHMMSQPSPFSQQHQQPMNFMGGGSSNSISANFGSGTNSKSNGSARHQEPQKRDPFADLKF